MQASGQYGVPPEVPQFVVGRVPSATTAAVAAASASAHSHMFSISHDMPVSNSSQQNPNPHPPPPQQQHQQQQQMVTQKIRLESDSREVVPSPNLNNNTSNNNNNNNSNTDSLNKQLVPVGNNEQQQVQVGGGEEDVLDCERGSAGNRWPRQETLALLKIRSEMDANFRDASLKGPLWEDVSRRLAQLGYYRSAKKCKEKFENVHKYYKRTKEGRAGRQDGKSYKFFSQLEALYGSSNATHNSNHNNNNDGSSNNNGNSNKVTVAAIGGGPGAAAAAAITAAGNLPATATAPLGVSTREIINPTSTIKTTTTTAAAAVTSNPTTVHRPALDFSAAAAAFNFSSDSSSEDEYDEPEESEQTDHISRKRKRSSSMTAFFENLMKQVIEKQEAMQQKFLEAIEKREQDRMIREEAWKRQEIARLSREQELKSQERSLTATRDAALVAFLQKVTGQTIQIPQLPSIIQPQNIAPPQPPPPPPPLLPENQHNSDHEHHNQECKELVTFDPNSKRWPKPEVLALIKLRSGMEQRFHEAGPKGPLWEEISQGMAYLGYSRSAKRCKEKWENINKYFRKAKESNKKRPENAKTCPYFHQLDALYRKKILGNPSKQNKIMEQGYEGGGGGGGGHDQQNKIIIMQEDQNLIEPQQQNCESSREDNSAHTQPGEHGTAASGATTDILAIMPPPPAGSETHAVTYHHERTSSSTTRDASFMAAMVQKLAAPDPTEFNMSTSSNTE